MDAEVVVNVCVLLMMKSPFTGAGHVTTVSVKYDGCGPAEPVQGTVSWDGLPVAAIMFQGSK